MKTIKGFLFNFIFSFLVMVFSFWIMPLVSYADILIPTISYDEIVPSGNMNFTTTSGNGRTRTGSFRNMLSSSSSLRSCIVKAIANNTTVYCRVEYNIVSGDSSCTTLNGSGSVNSLFYCYVESGYDHNSTYYDLTSTVNSVTCPVFGDNIGLVGYGLTPFPISDYEGSAFYDYLVNNNLHDTLNVDGYGVSNEPLGVIKPKYSANGSDTTASTFREYVEWEPLSTSGFDITGAGVGVQFAIKDKSYYHNHRLGQPSNLYDFIYSRVSWLASNVYPYGSSQRSWLQGQSTNSALYGKMRVIGEAMGSTLQYGFSTWSFYANQNVDSKLSTFGNALLNNNTSSIMDTVMATSDANASVCLSYDIYARIHDGGGQRYGNWLKINKHSVPVDQQSNRLNGGVTKEPVIIPGFNPSNDDWFDTEDETPSDDPDDEDEDPLPTGINDPDDGSPTYIYNNYTYNYDNRTWIENHYDNQTVDDVNTALDWIKLFPRFFGLFMSLFGTFLPGWAAVCVTIFIPILCGLLVFKVFKVVIPFV